LRKLAETAAADWEGKTAREVKTDSDPEVETDSDPEVEADSDPELGPLGLDAILATALDWSIFAICGKRRKRIDRACRVGSPWLSAAWVSR